MKLIRTIENKIRLAFLVSVGSLLTAVLLVGMMSYYSFLLVQESRQSIYVLEGGVPTLVKRSSIAENRKVEYSSHVTTFHSLFFTLPPDDEYIAKSMKKAMYLIDESGMIEYNNLKEKGYFNAILASSATLSIMGDSVTVDMESGEFIYYGTQRIERKSSVLTRRLVTTGSLTDVPRSENNPHGVIITGWKTLLNIDLSKTRKNDF